MAWWRSAYLGLFAVFVCVLFGSGAHAQESWQAKWNNLIAAAQKEGVVVVSGPPGTQQRKAITEGWSASFPDIRLEYTAARGSQIVAKVVRERAAGLFNWDIILASTDPTVFSLVPINALAPIRDALVIPELQENKTWIGGFETGFVDKGKKFFYSAIGAAGTLGYVNRACLSKEQFNKAEDMKRADLKGKIVWYDPTRPGTGTQGTGLLSLVKGKAWLKDLFIHHDITFSREYQQMTNWLVACTKPIAIGMQADALDQMQKNGIGTQVEELDGSSYFGDRNPGGVGGNASIGWYHDAPHPNAAKLFVNWYLSHDLQQRYASLVQANSRRTDVPPTDPKHVLKVGVDYFDTNEANIKQVKLLQAEIKTWGVLK